MRRRVIEPHQERHRSLFRERLRAHLRALSAHRLALSALVPALVFALVLGLTLSCSAERPTETTRDAALDRLVARMNAAFSASPPDLAAYFDALDTDDHALRARLEQLERFAHVSLTLGAEMNRRFGPSPSEPRDTAARESLLHFTVETVDGDRARLVATAPDGARHAIEARRRRGVWRLDAAATPEAAALGRPSLRRPSLAVRGDDERPGHPSALSALTAAMEHALEQTRAGELASRDAVEATVGSELARRLTS